MFARHQIKLLSCLLLFSLTLNAAEKIKVFGGVKPLVWIKLEKLAHLDLDLRDRGQTRWRRAMVRRAKAPAQQAGWEDFYLEIGAGESRAQDFLFNAKKKWRVSVPSP